MEVKGTCCSSERTKFDFLHVGQTGTHLYLNYVINNYWHTWEIDTKTCSQVFDLYGRYRGMNGHNKHSLYLQGRGLLAAASSACIFRCRDHRMSAADDDGKRGGGLWSKGAANSVCFSRRFFLEDVSSRFHLLFIG